MTREEAIEKLERRLSNMKFVGDVFVDCIDGEALEMAIEALKEKPELRLVGKLIGTGVLVLVRIATMISTTQILDISLGVK